MNLKLSMLAAAGALCLAACGGNDAPGQDTASPATTPADTPAATPGGSAAPAPGAPGTDTSAPAGQTGAMDPGTSTSAGTGTGTGAATQDAATEAVVADCATTIEGNDAMRFNVNSITVPSSCSEFTINLQHTGQLPVAAMGHNVVITSASDMQAVAADGLAAGADNDYVKPDDERVIAHTELVGGGESTSVSFPVSAIQDGGPYEFFCSFPGHSALMKGTIQVGS